MYIECQLKPDQYGMFIIFVNGEEWRRIHRSIFGNKPRIPLEYQQLSDLESWFQQAELKGARKFSLARLALKSQSSSELRIALQRVMVSDASIDITLKECEALGYLDDQDWIERFIRRQCERKIGPRLIASKLRSKGIKEEEIAAAFQNNQMLLTEAPQILNLIQRRYSKKGLTDFRARQKVFAALMRKGFHPHEILEALDKYLTNN
ncbi:MAG TPA: regulatory protein RecX [Waddliaceae bacterium]